MDRRGGLKLRIFRTDQWNSLVCHFGISRKMPSEILWFISRPASTSATYPSSNSASSLKDGDTEPTLMQDRSTS
jgi:hypothetical protein